MDNLGQVEMVVPELWTTVINLIRQDYPGAIIAGGALRDLYHGRVVKDVDIFVPVDSYVPRIGKVWWSLAKFVAESALAKAMPSLEYRTKFDTYTGDGNEEAPVNSDRVLHCILTFDVDGTKFEIIVTDPYEASVHSFDINLCQIQYDGKEVLATEAFFDGSRNKVLKVCNINRTDRQVKRMQRLSEKYPDFKLEYMNDNQWD